MKVFQISILTLSVMAHVTTAEKFTDEVIKIGDKNCTCSFVFKVNPYPRVSRSKSKVSCQEDCTGMSRLIQIPSRNAMDVYEFRVKASKGRARLIQPKIRDQVTEDQVLEGDMILTRDQLQKLNESLIRGTLEGVRPKDPPRRLNGALNNAQLKSNFRWPDNTLSYQILRWEGHETIRNTLRNLQRKIGDYQGSGSCVKFVEKHWGPRVEVVDFDRGCSSQVGYLGYSYHLNLARGCMKPGIIEHEFLHALGIKHTQSRHDRNKHVKIIWDNIIRDEFHNFNEYRDDQVTHFGIPYDYKSVMHYGSKDFSKNGGMTIETLDSDKQSEIGQRDGVTDSDIKLVRKMYQCDGDCTTTGGTSSGRKCVFPFTYDGTTYDFCPPWNGGFWCSVDAHFHGNWGYCNEETCPLQPMK